ncbi:MAG: hypothetical protein EOP49_09625 [Sphingobacteriales bacterium]|nr:MAG: hypothetical protein EOP49_09625 [Sphingobacteriales bacterium]
MIKLYLPKVLMCLAFLLFVGKSQAQVSVVSSSTTGTHATLKEAFDGINSGTYTGSIQLLITGNTVETAAAVLNASGSGSALYGSITIKPDAGVTASISGSITGGLIKLNGADNVTIDGGKFNGSGSDTTRGARMVE